MTTKSQTCYAIETPLYFLIFYLVGKVQENRYFCIETLEGFSCVAACFASLLAALGSLDGECFLCPMNGRLDMTIGRFPTLNLSSLCSKGILTFITFHAPCILEVTALNERVALRIEFYCLSL